jgi:excisionase family DNA binding protein
MILLVPAKLPPFLQFFLYILIKEKTLIGGKNMKKENYAPRFLQVLTRKDAAAYLKISTRTLDKIVKSGKIRKFSAGDRTVRFLQADIYRYIDYQIGIKTISGGDADENINV